MPADQIRNRTVGCKMSDSEYERLSAVVESEGMTLGEWYREVLLERADGRKPSVIEETLLAEVLALRTILLNAFYKLANDLGGQGSWSPRGEEQETGSEFDTVNYSCCDFVTSKQPTAEDGGDSADSTPSASQQPAQQTPEKSPDPNLPVNRSYILAVENDSGINEPDLDARAVEYDLHNAPDTKNPNGAPVDPQLGNASVISEHLSNKSLKEGTGQHGQFDDNIGPGGDRVHTGTIASDRYFTLTLGGKQMGVVPIKDRFGTHLVDHFEIHEDAVNPKNNYTVLNGHRGPTDVF